MRATGVLQRCLSDGLEAMHATRSRVLLRAVEALLAGRRLTLMDVARSWPGAERVRAPLKALDRLLSNRHLHAERERVYANMAHWLLRGERPVIVIDWSDLKADKAWCLLRAAVPVGGRTLPVLDMVFPGWEAGSPVAEQRFLQRLKQVVPESITPLLVTDAGFRSPWFRAVSKLLDLAGTAPPQHADQAGYGPRQARLGALARLVRTGERGAQRHGAHGYRARQPLGLPGGALPQGGQGAQTPQRPR